MQETILLFNDGDNKAEREYFLGYRTDSPTLCFTIAGEILLLKAVLVFIAQCHLLQAFQLYYCEPI